MSIRITCPNPECGRRLKLRDDLAGKRVRCPECQGAIRVPGKESAADELVGKKLAHYEIISKIGEGGMGAVYQARNLSLNKIVALKVLPPSLQKEDPSFVKRFVREAQSTAQLDHPNVVTVHYVGREGDYHFIEMEYVDGKPLRELLRNPDNITVAQATRITVEAAKALASAHEKGIFHRDVTPDNILITTHGKVKVADFGLASLGDDEERVRKGKVFGTPYYMSPEHCRGLATDGRGDIYSLGATYYHMLTGQPPYYGERPEIVVRMHVKAPVPSPQAIRKEIPDEVDKIVGKMMAKNPDERYQSCDDLIGDLKGETLAGDEITRRMVAEEKGDDEVEVVLHSPLGNVLAGVAAVALVAILSALFIVIFDPFPHAAKPEAAPKAAPAQPEQSQTAKTPAPAKPKPVRNKPEPEPKEIAATLKTEPKPKPDPKAKPPAQVPKAPEAAPPKPAQSFDPKAYAAAVGDIDKLVDLRKFDGALAGLKELLGKMPAAKGHIAIKQDNIARLKKQWGDLLSANLKEKGPIPMERIAKQHAYAGLVINVQETGLVAENKGAAHIIKWDRLSKDESLLLIASVFPPRDADAALGLAIFCMEGAEKLLDKAEGYLSVAKGLGADTAKWTAELAFLRSVDSPVEAKPEPKPPPAKPAQKDEAEKKPEDTDKKDEGAALKDLRKTFKNVMHCPFSAAGRLTAMKVQIPPNPRFARGKSGKALIIEPRQTVEMPVQTPKAAGMIEFWVLLSGAKAEFPFATGSESPPEPAGQRKARRSDLFTVQIAKGLHVAFQKTADGKPARLETKDEFPWEKWMLVSIYWGPDGFKLFLNEKPVAEGEGKGLGGDLRSISFANRTQGRGKQDQKEGQPPSTDTLVVLEEVILYAGTR
ncbi:MAG: protein kinase [Planctomycetota bacterium]